MLSTFTWLDYSERDRRAMIDVISLFHEQDTRDELGIGTVRDAFADLLFPGTSTIQRRARYFFFIPWMYRELERRKTSSAEVAARARQEEIALSRVLSRSDDSEGTIGQRAGAGLKRLPSSIYWQGLRRWGICLFPGSQDQYQRRLDGYYVARAQRQYTDDREPLDGAVPEHWHGGLPPAPHDFPKNATFRLTPAEATYLRERILARVPGTLLAFLADEGQPVDASVRFPWEHPQFAAFAPRIQEQLRHAQNFSEAMHGAALLYNWLLATRVQDAELVADYAAELERWAEILEERQADLAQWDRHQFWNLVVNTGARVSVPTRQFIETWLNLALTPGRPQAILQDTSAQQLLYTRETALKRGRARLTNQRPLELWSGASGAWQLDYRWPVARRMVNDMLAALTPEDSNAGPL
jgi:hypothetical protein